MRRLPLFPRCYPPAPRATGVEDGGREGVDAGHYKALQRVLLTLRVQSAPCSKIKHEMTRQRFARLSLSNPSAYPPPNLSRRSLVLLLPRPCLATVYTHTHRLVTRFFHLLVLAIAPCRHFYRSIPASLSPAPGRVRDPRWIYVGFAMLPDKRDDSFNDCVIILRINSAIRVESCQNCVNAFEVGFPVVV